MQITSSSIMPGDWRPALARSVLLRRDRVRDTDLLLMPERAVVLSGPGGRILRLCDGTRTRAQIVAELAPDFPGSPIAVIAADVAAFLTRIQEQGWVR